MANEPRQSTLRGAYCLMKLSCYPSYNEGQLNKTYELIKHINNVCGCKHPPRGRAALTDDDVDADAVDANIERNLLAPLRSSGIHVPNRLLTQQEAWALAHHASGLSSAP